MNKENIDKLRTALIEACDKQIKNGTRIAIGAFGNGKDWCCPIQCLVGKKVEQKYADHVAKRVGFDFSDTDLWLFIGGFDRTADQLNADYKKNPLVKLGQEIREKYIVATKAGTDE